MSGSLVQVVGSNLTVAGTTKTSTAISTTAKNALLFLAVYNAANAGVVTPSDSTSQTWISIGTYSGGATGLTLAAWYAKSITGNAANTFTFATTGADTPTFFVGEFSGRDLNAPFDAFLTASDTVSASGAHTTGTFNARGGSDLIAFNVSSALLQSYTATGLWAIPPNGTITSGTGYDAFVQYINNANNGANPNTYSVATADKLDAFIVSLKPPALPYSDEWLDGFQEVPEVAPFYASAQQRDVPAQVSETDYDWLDESAEGDAWTLIEAQSSGVIADRVTSGAAQYYGEDAELLDEVLNLEPVPSGRQNSDNFPPVYFEEPWDWGTDDAWGNASIPFNAGYQQSDTAIASAPRFEDAWEDEDPDDFFADDFGNDDADLPQNDVWDHWPTDEDDYAVEDSFILLTNPGPQPITVEDGWTEHWPTDDDDYFIVDEYALAPNPLLSLEDPWLPAFDDGADLEDEYWWIENETDYRLVDNNPVIDVEDAFDHFVTDDDDYVVIDDYALVTLVPGALLTVEDAFDHFVTDDDDYVVIDDYALVTLLIAPSMPPEDAFDHLVTDDADAFVVPDDYTIVDVAPSLAVPVDDAWDWNTTDDDDYVVIDDYASVNNTPLVAEDAFDHFVTDPDDEAYQALDADQVSVPQPAAIEDSVDHWTQNADDEEWVFRDADAVAPLAGLNTPTDGWDHFLTDEDEWVVPEDYQQQNFVVAPSQFTDEAYDWFYEPAEDNEMDFAVTDSLSPPNVYISDPNFEVYMLERNWVVTWLPTADGAI